MRFLKSEYGFPNIKNQKNHSEYRMVFFDSIFSGRQFAIKII